jgi:hypothetical protein
LLLARWKILGAPGGIRDVLPHISCVCFLGAYLDLLACFGYIAVDARKVRLGFPARLLLKPVTTTRLVLVPMLFGGSVIVATFVIWSDLVLGTMVQIDATTVLWISGVLLSFFWWMQALAWSLPLVRFRSLVMLAVGLIHLAVGVMPQLPFGISSGWQWGIVAALLVSAVAFAWVGLKLMRQGKWDGPSRISALWSGWRGARARTLHKRFRSAFAAQFWLEWRRQGWLLPGLSGSMAVLVCPFVFFVGFKWAGVDAPPPAAVLVILLISPLLLSGAMGPVMAKFDQLDSARELPSYISVRPMTNGGFVMAKLAMALTSSALTLLLAVAGVCICQAITDKGTLFSKAGLVTAIGPVPYITGCAPVLLLLVILTWKNLMAGISTGLTGRPWIANLFSAWRGATGMGLLALIMAAKLYEDFRGVLLNWLTVILIVCLAAKVTVSITAFVIGAQRNAITARAICWIGGGWSVCGLFVVAYAAHVCSAISQPGLRIWVTLGGLFLLPLADLAIAPLALAWNRHR